MVEDIEGPFGKPPDGLVLRTSCGGERAMFGDPAIGATGFYMPVRANGRTGVRVFRPTWKRDHRNLRVFQEESTRWNVAPVPEFAAASNVMACVADALMVKRVTEHGVREMAAMLATRVVQAQLDKLAASTDWSAKVRDGVKQAELKRKEQEARAVGWDPEPDL